MPPNLRRKMVTDKITTPEYLIESSWEVCNKVGGIYTVLSTKALTLQTIFKDKVLFVGPDIRQQQCVCDFQTDENLFADWRLHAAGEGLNIKVGRWAIPGQPPVVLVDFRPFYKDKDKLYFEMWNSFGVDSLHAYGDYDDSCIFAYAVARVIESFYRFYHLEQKRVVAHFNEWMLGMGLLYVQKHLPGIATIFTTHATSIGRSIAGNNKALYAYMRGYHGDQMAHELNMEAKHSIEKQTAHYADCFTTVSDITACECRQLLEKAPDVVTPNGFELDFVPEKEEYAVRRKEARRLLIGVAEKLSGSKIAEDALLVSTSGRYEFRNKGIDVFIEAMNRLRLSDKLHREVVAFIMVPAWVRDKRADLKEMMDNDVVGTKPMQMPYATHWLNRMENDRILGYIQQLGFPNTAAEKLKIVFIPCYLDGRDGIFNKPYYDMLIGLDVTVYPSYYEPWGYTPLESIAFGIPTITTTLAGFGLWARKSVAGNDISEGVVVVERTDSNYREVADKICDKIVALSEKSTAEIESIHEHCTRLAEQAQWSKFITYYQNAFCYALAQSCKRNG